MYFFLSYGLTGLIGRVLYLVIAKLKVFDRDLLNYCFCFPSANCHLTMVYELMKQCFLPLQFVWSALHKKFTFIILFFMYIILKRALHVHDK